MPRLPEAWAAVKGLGTSAARRMSDGPRYVEGEDMIFSMMARA